MKPQTLAAAGAALALLIACSAAYAVTSGPTVPSPSTTRAAPSPTSPGTVTPSAASTSGYPDASTTGVPDGTTLTRSGGLRVTTAGTVLDARDVTGIVTIAADNVQITRSRITAGSGDSFAVKVESGSVSITDSEIIGGQNAIGYDNWTATRVDISGQTQDGVKLGSNVTLQDSYIHDLLSAAGEHADAGQMQNGVVNLTIRRNNLSSYNRTTGSLGNAALFLAPDLGPSTNGPVTVTDNLLDGGSYTLYNVDGGDHRYFVKNMTFTNNAFGRHHRYGPSNTTVPMTASGNRWADTGAALTL